MTSIHECIDCAALPPDDRPLKPRPAVHGGPRSRRCATHWRAHKAAKSAGQLIGKVCKECLQPLENYRRTYHEECIPAAKARAQSERRRCGKCRKTRAASKFVNDSTRADGKFPWCVYCQKAGLVAGRFQDPEDEPNGHICPLCDTSVRGSKNRRYCSTKCKDRVKALRDRFGLTPKQYRELVKATNGHCPLCNCRPKFWAVDHDHRTGMVTGVVCTGCNVGLLAVSYHNIDRVRTLLTYLERTPAARLGINVKVPEGQKAKPSQIHKMWRFNGRAAS